VKDTIEELRSEIERLERAERSAWDAYGRMKVERDDAHGNVGKLIKQLRARVCPYCGTKDGTLNPTGDGFPAEPCPACSVRPDDDELEGRLDALLRVAKSEWQRDPEDSEACQDSLRNEVDLARKAITDYIAKPEAKAANATLSDYDTSEDADGCGNDRAAAEFSRLSS